MAEQDLLTMSEADWWKYKADFCRSLYIKGLEYPAWTDERAMWWLKAIMYFVEEFIRPEFPVPKFHNDWYYWAVKERAYMNLSPRDHAKTTVHSIIRVVWEICCNRNITFFIIFATTDVSKLILSQIKSQLTQNPYIKAGFGIFNPMDLPAEERTVDQDWSQNSITVNRDNYAIKDPTVAVAGALTNVLSRRVDRLIVDDLLTDKIAFSEAESERLTRWYFNDVQPVLKSDGQEIITGTRYRRGDFYDGIINMSRQADGIYQIFIGDAIIDEAREKTLWPERWNYENLMRQRAKMGSVRFNRNYRNRITSDEDSPFPMVWFTGGADNAGNIYKGCFDHSLVMQSSIYDRGTHNQLRVTALGVDPAIGTTDEAKYFVVVVLGMTVKNVLVIADIVRGKFSFPAQKRIIMTLNEIWRPRYISVEANAYQKALVQGLEEDNSMLPIMPFVTKNVGQHKPDIGVPSMDIFFETGRMRIPYGDAESQAKADLLVEELHYWGKSNTSDIAMALWFAFERLRPEIERLAILPPAKNMAFADRKVYDNQRVTGLAGLPVPRAALSALRDRAVNAPLAHLSPVYRDVQPKLGLPEDF